MDQPKVSDFFDIEEVNGKIFLYAKFHSGTRYLIGEFDSHDEADCVELSVCQIMVEYHVSRDRWEKELCRRAVAKEIHNEFNPNLLLYRKLGFPMRKS